MTRRKLSAQPFDAPNRWRRRLLRAGGLAALSPGLLAACGSDDPPAPAPAPEAPPAPPPEVTPPPSFGGPVTGAPPPPRRTVFSVSGRTILRNNEPFQARGFCYSPVPVGGDFAYQPWGDFFADVGDGLWAPIHERDLPLMQQMGVNSIRVYTLSTFVEPWNPAGARQTHLNFLDACHAHGISVWVTHPIAAGVFRGPAAGRDATAAGVRALADDVGDHPAVMGFVIGNEINNGTDRADPAWWNWLDTLAAICKSLAPEKLTMACFVDDAMQTIEYAESVGGGASNLDVFGINSYRGRVDTGFDNLFATYASATHRPLLITEFGCPASTRDAGGAAVELPDRARAQADYLVSHWKDIDAHRDICSGGYVFAWSDEWWKHGGARPDVHDASPAPNPAFPGGWGDEEWFGIHAVAPNPGRPPADPVVHGQHLPDVLTPRAARDALAALWGGQ